MRRGRSTGKPTKAQQARHDAIREAGCIVAYSRGLGFVPCELHHLTGGLHGQKRQGHDHVVGLNTWSHRGEPFGGMTVSQCLEMFGPSYAKQPRAFREQVGDDERLVRLQRELLGEG